AVSYFLRDKNAVDKFTSTPVEVYFRSCPCPLRGETLQRPCPVAKPRIRESTSNGGTAPPWPTGLRKGSGCSSEIERTDRTNSNQIPSLQLMQSVRAA